MRKYLNINNAIQRTGQRRFLSNMEKYLSPTLEIVNTGQRKFLLPVALTLYFPPAFQGD